MAAKVLFLPGILGSELWHLSPIPFLIADSKVWINPVQLLGGGLGETQLAADGNGPGPLAGGRELTARSPLSQFYGPLVAWLSGQGLDVFPLGYDWRKPALVSATYVWGRIQNWLGNAPLYIVAHSQGGIVARWVYGLMSAAGRAGQLARLICIGTPHYGAWEAAWVWLHLAHVYRWLLETCDRWHRPLARAVSAVIDAIAGTWPGMYELMPFASYGPLYSLYPLQAQQLYTASWYQPPASPFVSATWLAAAAAAQQGLQQWAPAAVMVGIYGTDVSTPVAIAPGGNPNSAGGYLFTTRGDGTVTVDEGALPGVPQFLIRGSHELLCQIPEVQAFTAGLIARGPGQLDSAFLHSAGVA